MTQIDKLINIIKQADRAILDVYNSPSFNVENKEDASPITAADRASHVIITTALSKLFPNIPIVSEEGDHDNTLEILRSDKFWLVDPMDGTKEFVNRNDQFSICVALIQNGKTVFGIVSIPTKDTVYYGGPGLGAFKKVANNNAVPIRVATEETGVVTASLSHLNDEITSYISEHYPTAKITRAGSSLKAMMVAEGLADAQPAINTQMKLWDLAAGHAIVEGAGGYVSRLDGSAINYQSTSLLIGDFITRSREKF